MRRMVWGGLLVVLLLAGGFSTGYTQDATEPLYGVVFGADDRVYVATVDAAGEWSLEMLPEGALYAQRDVALMRPIWHGDSVYYALEREVPGENEGDYRVITDIHRYDVSTGESGVAVADIPMGEFTRAQFVNVAGISENGRYAWATEILAFNTFILDLETGEILAAYECYGPIRDESGPWLVGVLDVIGGDCSDVVVLNTETGDVFRQTVFTYDKRDVVVVSDTLLFVSDGYSTIELIDMTTQEIVWFQEILFYSRHNQGVDYMTPEDGAFRLSYATLESEPVDTMEQGGEPNTFEARDEGSTYSLFRYDEAGDTFVHLIREEVNSVEVAPDHQSAVVVPQRASTTLDYYTLDSMMTITLPDGVLVDYARPVSDRDLILADAVIDDITVQRIIIDSATGETFLAPESDLSAVGVSPDGVRWLYSSEDHARLVAYHAESGELVTLLEDVNLAQSNFHFAPPMYYRWSDMLSGGGE